MYLERKIALQIIKALKEAENNLNIKQGEGFNAYGLRQAVQIVNKMFPPTPPLPNHLI